MNVIISARQVLRYLLTRFVLGLIIVLPFISLPLLWPQAKSMTAQDVAQIFKIWAIQNGMLGRERLGEELESEDVSGVIEDVSPKAASEILQYRVINFIGFNNKANEVVVYTNSNVQRKELPQLPASIGNTKIAYIKAGAATAGKPPLQPMGVMPYTLHKNRYTCGSSIFVGSYIGAGTFGCLTIDISGNVFGLSNNHITGGCNFSENGLPITAPGPRDVYAGGLDPFTIGHHHGLIQMVDGLPENVSVEDNTDAAIFSIKDLGTISSMQRKVYDTPTSVRSLGPGMTVEKVGRTTGHTSGHVRVQSSGPEPVDYSIRDLNLRKTVYFDPVYIVEGDSGPFADLGDSGSLITTLDEDGERHAVGVVFAISGDSDRALTFALSIKPILDLFGVTLVSNHNV